MNYDHEQRRALVTGMSRSGKTTLATHLALNWDARWKFIYDPDREFAQKLGWPVAISQTEIVRLASNFRPVCFDPVPMFGPDLERGLEWFADRVLRACRVVHGRKLFAVDEIWKYTGRVLGPGLSAINHEGRRQEIDSLIVSQQLNATNQVLRMQATEIWAFYVDEKRSLEWLADEGFDADEVKALRAPGGFVVKEKWERRFRRGYTLAKGQPVFATAKIQKLKVV